MAKTKPLTFTDKVSRNLGLLPVNLQTGLANGVQQTARTVQKAGVKRLRTSVTPTGQARAAGEAPRYSKHSDGRPVNWNRGGPGRDETGRLIASARYVITGIGTSKVTGTTGFINPPDYLRTQDRIAGTDGQPLGVIALTRATARATFKPNMEAEARRALNLSKQGRTLKLES